MTERPFNGGNKEEIFKKFEDRNRLREEKKQAVERWKDAQVEQDVIEIGLQDNRQIEELTVEKVVDDNSGTPKVIEFFAKHPKITKVAAGVGAFGTIISGVAPVAAAEAPTAIEYKQPGGEAPSQTAYDKLISGNYILASAETTTSKEVVQAPLVTKLLIQTESPYAMVTNSITGDVNVLKKNDTTVSMVSGRNMVPVRWAEYLGYEVAWNGATKTATLSNETKKVSLVLGSNIMTIEETGKETRKVTMDVATQTDKNGRTIIPIGYFGREAMGVDVQWDGATKTIGVNYSKDEFAKVTKTEKAVKEMKYQALQYVAGGEYMDANKFTNPLEKLSVGATVVYSSEKNKATEKAEVLKYQSKLKSGDVVYCIGGKTYLVRPNATVNQIKKEGVYQLNSMIEIKFPEMHYLPTIRVDYKTNGLVASDLSRVTHDYDTVNKKWTERSEYELLGNPEQRIRSSLNKWVNAVSYKEDKTTQKWTEIKNPLGLELNEVKKYCNTGVDAECKTFKVMKDAKGKPAFFVVTGGASGVGNDVYNMIDQTVARYNEIDPTIMNLICDREGIDCIVYDIPGTMGGYFDMFPSWLATYDTNGFGQVIFINKNNENAKFTGKDGLYQMELLLFVEARANRFRQHQDIYNKLISMDDVLSNKPGVVNEEADKFRFLLKYLDENWLPSKKMTKSEYDTLKLTAESTLKAYDPTYVRTWKDLDASNFAPEK